MCREWVQGCTCARRRATTGPSRGGRVVTLSTGTQQQQSHLCGQQHGAEQLELVGVVQGDGGVGVEAAQQLRDALRLVPQPSQGGL